MSGSISIDVGFQDLYFDDIAKIVVDDNSEAELLQELARALTSQMRDSTHDGEKSFAAEGTKRLNELAKWFRENAP